MKKIGIIVDSSSGISQEEANAKGWEFLPLINIIDNKEYKDGVNLKIDEYYQMLSIDNDVKTASTPLGLIEESFAKMSKEFEKVIVYPISEFLSSQYSNLMVIAQSYDNIFVIPSRAVSRVIVDDCNILEKMELNNEEDWEKIKMKALDLANSHFGLVIPKTLDWLIKGGRISSGVASMANLLKIVPIVSLDNGKLEKFGKGRVFDKTFVKLLVHFKDMQKKNKDLQFTILHGNNPEIDKYVEVAKQYISVNSVSLMPSVITSHLGPGSLAIISQK